MSARERARVSTSVHERAADRALWLLCRWASVRHGEFDGLT
jgi:hypothetical protein